MIVFRRLRGEDGFALPTILIASTILMIVLTVTAAAAASISVSLGNQYYNQLAHEAAESGLSYARYCYNVAASPATSTQWPNSGNLTQGTDCFGTQKSGQNCTGAPGTQFCGIVNTSTVRTTFSVGAPVVDSDSASYSLEVTGTTQLLRTSDHAVYQTITSVLDQQVSINLYGIASGNDTTCSIQAGQLYCWGTNTSGQVGNGTTSTAVTTPYHVQNFPPVGGVTYSYVQYVATGISHTCAVVGTDATPSDGNQVYCWGDNSYAQFGNGTTSSGSTIPVAGGSGMSSSRYIGCTTAKADCTAISARDHTCVMTESNSYPGNPADVGEYCWGRNEHGQAGLDSTSTYVDPKTSAGRYMQIASDGSYVRPTELSNVSGEGACAVSAGAVYCWGYNSSGEFGNGTHDTAVHATAYGASSPLNSGVTGVATNNGRVCALKSGALYCWGSNANYRLDSGAAASVYSPIQLVSATQYGGAITAFAITDWNSCIVASGNVWCSGYNDLGQLGQGTTGSYNSATNADSGPVVTNGTATSASQVRPASKMEQVKGVLSGQTVTDITSGNNHFCAITITHASYCWGANDRGQLGNGSTTNSLVPTPVHIPATVIY